MKKFLTIVLCAVALAACSVTQAPVATTPAMRLVQADGAYKAIVATVKDGVLRGSIKGENATRVKAALAAARTALDVWTLAPSDPTAEQTVLLSLQAVRSLLQSIAPPRQTKLALPYIEEGTYTSWRPTFTCSWTSCSQAGLTTFYRSSRSTLFSRRLSPRSGIY